MPLTAMTQSDSCEGTSEYSAVNIDAFSLLAFISQIDAFNVYSME